MKKQALLLLCLSMLFVGSTITSCSKKSDNEPKKEEKKEEEKENPNLSPYLKGSDYYVLALDAESEKSIKSKIKKDYRVDDTNMFLYVWEGTYNAGTSSGPNAFGEVEGWTSLVVGTVGWSGCGLSPSKTYNVDLSGVTAQHTFHIAMKSKDNASHVLIFNDGTPAHEVKVVIGATAAENTQPYKDFTRNGEWQHIEIPVSYLYEKGLKYTGEFNANVLGILSGGVAGTELNVDGVFFYKK